MYFKSDFKIKRFYVDQKIYNYTKILFLFTTPFFNIFSLNLSILRKRETNIFSSLSLLEAAFLLFGKLQIVSSSSYLFIPLLYLIISFLSSYCVFFSPITNEPLWFYKLLLLRWVVWSCPILKPLHHTFPSSFSSSFSVSQPYQASVATSTR